MKTRCIQLILLAWIAAMPAVAQKSDRKAEKEKKRLEKEKEIAALIDSKTFVFRADRAIPTGYRSVDLTTNPNFVNFSPEKIVSAMPYFGKAYTSHYSGDTGLKFEGQPESYTVEKKKKNYEIEAKVKTTNDFFTINLSVSFEGSSSMSISSNNRTTISYNGEIYPPEEESK
jgi:hypothetical protein